MGGIARRAAKVTRIGRRIEKFLLKRQVAVAVLLGRRRRCIELMREVLALDPDDADSRNALGNLLYDNGEPAAATAEFIELLERQPGNAAAWFNLGFVHESRDKLAEAERCFRRALELNSGLDRAWYGLGLTLIRGGRLDEAVGALERNIELQPFSPYGFYQLGMTYHHLGRRDDASRIVRQLRGVEPRYAATLLRDIERTPPAASAGGAGPGAPSTTRKEAITAT